MPDERTRRTNPPPKPQGRYAIQDRAPRASQPDVQEVRIESLEGDVKELKEDVSVLSSDLRKIDAGIQEIKIQNAGKSHEMQKLVAVLTLCGTGLTVLSNYLMRPPPPEVTQQTAPLSPEIREKLRLLEQRDGYRLGQQPPYANEPVEIRDAGID